MAFGVSRLQEQQQQNSPTPRLPDNRGQNMRLKLRHAGKGRGCESLSSPRHENLQCKKPPKIFLFFLTTQFPPGQSRTRVPPACDPPVLQGALLDKRSAKALAATLHAGAGRLVYGGEGPVRLGAQLLEGPSVLVVKHLCNERTSYM